MDEPLLLVYVTFPDVAVAEAVVRTAVEQRFAACGNLIPGLRSIYRWQGAVETAEEVLVLFKTTAANLRELQRHILSLHPYQIPEIVATPILGGNSSYLDWVRESCSGT
jgi:periplasmic divalent cation tolerance protein